MLLLQLIVSGLQTGALYALTAAGFALIFGTTKVFHVAHGATFTLAGYVFLQGVTLGWPIWAAVVAASAATVLFGILAYIAIYRPILRHEASFFTVFVASFGLQIVAQALIELYFGRGYATFTTVLSRSQDIGGGLYIAPIFWLVAVVTVGLFVIVGLLIARTNIGIGLRALADSPTLIVSYGLSPVLFSILAFAIGSLLVVPGAIFTAATTGLQPSMTAHVMLISLAATIVGGVGSIRGAALAGLLLGVTENIAVYFLNTQFGEAASFIVLFLFILLRPSGLFGTRSIH